MPSATSVHSRVTLLPPQKIPQICPLRSAPTAPASLGYWPCAVVSKLLCQPPSYPLAVCSSPSSQMQIYTHHSVASHCTKNKIHVLFWILLFSHGKGIRSRHFFPLDERVSSGSFGPGPGVAVSPGAGPSLAAHRLPCLFSSHQSAP